MCFNFFETVEAAFRYCYHFGQRETDNSKRIYLGLKE
jgi:hypothetical protein